MIPRTLAIALLIGLPAWAWAQQLWLRPSQYFVSPGERVTVALQTGEDFIPEPVTFRKEDVVLLQTSFRTTKMDIRRNFQEGEKSSFFIDATQEGVHQYVFKTMLNKGMTAEAFADHTSQFDLQDASIPPGVDTVNVETELYIKGYIRVGKAVDKRPEVSSNVPLEIIPDRNPLTLNKGDRLVLTVYKEGKPAFGVRVKIWNRWNNRTTIQNIYTQQDGTISTAVSSPGDWMVTVVDLKKADDGHSYHEDVFQLIFGYR
jgi:uncharacterized GH25 family protein